MVMLRLKAVEGNHKPEIVEYRQEPDHQMDDKKYTILGSTEISGIPWDKQEADYPPQKVKDGIGCYLLKESF